MLCKLQDITVSGVEESITDMVGRETESVAINKVELRDFSHVDKADAGG